MPEIGEALYFLFTSLFVNGMLRLSRAYIDKGVVESGET